MGTIVAVCMLLGVVFAARLPILRNLPRIVNVCVALLVLAAGLWNVLWYGLQHIGEFWGFNALVSGLLMIVTALYIFDMKRIPAALAQARPIILVLLLCYVALYAITIYRL